MFTMYLWWKKDILELGFWLINRLFLHYHYFYYIYFFFFFVPILASSSIHWIKWLNQHIMVPFQIQTQKGKKREAGGEYTETSLVWKKIYISWSRYITDRQNPQVQFGYTQVQVWTSLNEFERVLNEFWTSLNMFGNSFNNFEWLF